MILDTLLFVVTFLLIDRFAQSTPRAAAVAMVIKYAGALLYFVACHAIWGRTLGKAAFRIRVLGLDGERIGWREAWLRSSVDIVLTVVSLVGMLITLYRTPQSVWTDLAWTERTSYLSHHRPLAFQWMRWVNWAWTFSEVIVFFRSRDSRAIHDFIAGTAVFVEQPEQDALVQSTADASLASSTPRTDWPGEW